MSSILSAAQRALLQVALQQRRDTLERQIAQQLDGRTRTEHARDLLLQDGDDAPARDADREVDLARSDSELGEMRAVNDALKRLDDGRYGLCIDCAEPIAFDRLQSHPEVPRCMACQSAHETQGGRIVVRTTI